MRAVESAVDAAWLAAAMTTFGGRVRDVAPAGFEAYARVLHPPRAGSWAAVAAANGRILHPAAQWERIAADHRDQAPFGALGGAQASALSRILAEHTSTPDDCFFAIWEGWGGLDADPAAAVVALPQRNYLLHGAAVTGAAHSFDRFTDRQANLWWPADRAWFVSSEIDFDSTVVAGSRALVDAVLASDLEALEVTADTDLSIVGDTLNG